MTILDTHILLYLAAGSPTLSQARRTLIAQSTRKCAISVVTVWEVALLFQKKRIAIEGSSLEEAIRDMIATSGFEVLPLTTDIAIASRTLPFEHEDPADRFIAATAIVHGAPLITDDVRLRGLDWLPTL